MSDAAIVRDRPRLPTHRQALSSAVLALSLAGCATTRIDVPRPANLSPPPAAREPVFSRPPGLRFGDLAGWSQDDHVAALAAFAQGCGVSRDAGMRAVCTRARALGAVPDGAARQFFEFNFRLEPASSPGVLTAYFAPEYEARVAPDPEFSAPVRPRPRATSTPIGSAADGAAPVDDPLDLLQDAAPPPAPAVARGLDRASLARVPGADALAWMRPEDLFFLQIQGSGALSFPDGRRLKAVYAGDNARPFVAIAQAMVRRGLLAPDRVSGETIRAWLAAHAGPQAQAVMDLDPRYVFFALEPDDGRDPRGAAGVALYPGRALAVDPAHHGFGELWWIEAEAPLLRGAVKYYRRLALALDTGSAIRGEARADLYLGRGRAAGEEAGRVRHTLRLVRLVPRGDVG